MTVPNYKKGVGRLATDRYDFQNHIDGYNNKHHAKGIVLSPPVIVQETPSTSITANNVQDAIAGLAIALFPPVIPDASTTVKGLVKLSGDIAGTANSVSVVKLRGYPIAANPPVLNQVLTYTASGWESQALPTFPLPLDATTGQKGVIQLSGDIAGTNTNIKVTGLLSIPILDTPLPTDGQVLTYDVSIGKWKPWTIPPAAGVPDASTSVKGIIKLAKDLGGTALLPTVIGLQGFAVKAIAPTVDSVLTYTATGWEPKLLSANVLSITTTTTMAATNKNTSIFVNPSADINITLPALPPAGMVLTFKDVSGNASNNTITLKTPASQTIEGLTDDYIMDADFQSLQLMADNSLNWWII